MPKHLPGLSRLLTIAGITFTMGMPIPTQAAESLEAFCLRTKADTPDNCRCGQKTANKIASAEEQHLMVRMMSGSPGEQQKLFESQGMKKMEGLMQKLSKISKGCNS